MGQHDGRGSLTAPVTGSRDSPDLIFTLETGGHAPDRWRVTINTPAAREWCATFSNGCFEHTHSACQGRECRDACGCRGIVRAL